jgi:flavin-dependent dehydrogenase
MTSKIAADERMNFSDRLQGRLRKAGVPVRASTVAHEFNLRADGATVTTHAVRKWLSGDAIPTHERMLILGSWLGVHASWLQYGDAQNTGIPISDAPALPTLATEELVLLRDFKRLTPEGQRILRELLTTLLNTPYKVARSHTT